MHDVRIFVDGAKQQRYTLDIGGAVPLGGMQMQIDDTAFTINCTGDACTGDVILFTEAVFGGSVSKPKFLGERRIAARIIKDSYGSAKQQHTFTIEVIGSDGYAPLTAGTKTTRKGRNIYRNGTMRQPWANEAERNVWLSDKHQRGNAARAAREERKNCL